MLYLSDPISNDTRISHGMNAQLGAVPYIVSLRDIKNKHFCGGSILNRIWVISAARCTHKRQRDGVIIAVGAISIRGGIVYKVAAIINHHQYNATERHSDLSLLRSKTSFVFSELVQPIGLGTSHLDGPVPATISGWGQLVGFGLFSNVLRFAYVSTITLSKCQKWYHGKYIHSSTICTVGHNSEAICGGDFGGPVVFKDKLIGVASWTTSCGRGYPDVATRVSDYYKWIITVMQQCVAH